MKYCFILAIIFAQVVSLMAQGGISNTPFSSKKPQFTTQTHPLAPTKFWGSLQSPYPTNYYWENIVLENGDNPSEQLPYMVKSLKNGLQISAFFLSGSKTSVISAFLANMMFSSAEAPVSHSLNRYDLLSFDVEWLYGNQNSVMESPVVRGSPFITMKYKSLTPVITTIHAILSVNGVNSGTVSSSKFKIVLNNGQTWLLYASSPIQLNIQGSRLSSTALFSGYLRLALLSSSSLESVLDSSKDVVPSGGKVSYNVTGDTATLTFDWSVSSGSASNLLLYALPHHIDLLQSSTPISTGIVTIKGKMQGIISNQWNLKLQLTTIQFNAKTPITDPTFIKNITDSLIKDRNKTTSAPDPYFFGKEIASMGRLALIADELNQNEIATSIRQNMKNRILPWLTGKNSDPLQYDSTYGGICSLQGLRNEGADFGNGYYNDHHFHYGYFLYACAAIGKEDPQFLSQNQEAILALVRDVANPSTADPFFPVTRHKDWFLGHSYAAGLFVFGDGRNQESTSEAINAYYGLYLLGLAFQPIDNNLGSEMAELGRVMLATEIVSVQKYWHIPSSSDIYPAVFRPNKMVGVLWSDKVDYATFFGANVEYIHCIQMLPFTPIMEEVLSPAFVTEEFPVVATALNRQNPRIEQSWMGYVFMDQAIINKQGALTSIEQRITAYDDGNSRTNTLYWVMSRPQ